jgi:hypothetical protein
MARAQLFTDCTSWAIHGLYLCMVYPYNAIMGWGSINKFEAAIHGL